MVNIRKNIYIRILAVVISIVICSESVVSGVELSDIKSLRVPVSHGNANHKSFSDRFREVVSSPLLKKISEYPHIIQAKKIISTPLSQNVRKHPNITRGIVIAIFFFIGLIVHKALPYYDNISMPQVWTISAAFTGVFLTTWFELTAFIKNKSRNEKIVISIMGFLFTFAAMNSIQFIVIPILSGLLGLGFFNIAQTFMGFFFVSYAVSVFVNNIFVLFVPSRIFKESTKYYSSEPKPMPNGQALPHVTIQIPVYKENFDQVIKKTLFSVIKAVEYYRKQGGTANIVIYDDGILSMADDDLTWIDVAVEEYIKNPETDKLTKDDIEIAKRIKFYREYMNSQDSPIGYVARSKYNRAGLFAKASNLNFGMTLAEDVRLLMSEKTGIGYQDALLEVSLARGPPMIAEGDIRLGEFLVLLDKDSYMPEDIIGLTIPEFLNDNKLGFTQHRTFPINANDNYFSKMIGTFTQNLFQLFFVLSTQGGDPSPLVGHNAFIRMQAMRDAVLDKNGVSKYWDDDRVSEDFSFSLRMQAKGYFGRYIAYQDKDFGEGVTRTFDEEAKKLMKFAYGASEMVFNNIREWFSKGIINEKFWQYLLADYVPWYSKVNLCLYISSYFAMASLFIFFPLQIILLAFGIPWGIIGVSSLWVMGQNILIFMILSSFSVLRVKFITQSEIPVSKHIHDNILFSIAYFGFYSGVLFSIFKGVISHMLGIPVKFGATNMDKLREAPRIEIVREISMTYRRQLEIAFGVIIFVIWAFFFWNPYPFWHIFSGIIFLAICHLLTPFAYNPVLISKRKDDKNFNNGPSNSTSNAIGNVIKRQMGNI